jgi:hypothetical protein
MPADTSPSPPFRGEREGPDPQGWEGEVGGATNRLVGPLTLPSPPGQRRTAGEGGERSEAGEGLGLVIVCVDNGHYGETGYQKSHTSLGVDLEKISAS